MKTMKAEIYINGVRRETKSIVKESGLNVFLLKSLDLIKTLWKHRNMDTLAIVFSVKK